MANDLTGDFDVVAEFTVPAVNRVLAAMHSGNRFPHSWSLRVDDVFHSKRTIRSIVDVNGDAVTDPVLVNAVALAPSSLRGHSASDPIYQSVDPLVNVGDPHVPGPADRGHLRGVAQLQFGPPTVTVPDDSGASLVTHTPVMARYFPDPGTMNVPEYLQGEVQVTLGAQEVFSQAGTFIDVSLIGLGGNIQFLPSWSSAPLAPPQATAINKAFRNALINSFQPSSTPLPSNILNMQFKTMPRDTPALAVLMNLPGGAYAAGQALGEGVFGVAGSGPDPADVTQVFLQDGDDFALAVSSDFVSRQFSATVNDWLNRSNLRQLSFPPKTFPVIVNNPDPLPGSEQVGSVTVSASASINNVTVQFVGSVPLVAPAGAIVLTISGHAHIHFDTSGVVSAVEAAFGGFGDRDFDFQILQLLNLQLTVTDDGDSTAQLVFVQDGSVSPTTPVDSLVGNQFTAIVQGIWKDKRDDALNQANSKVEPMLGVRENLGEFLKPLLKDVTLQLAYTSVEIDPAGVILRGSLQVQDWPQAVVEFESRVYQASSRTRIYRGTGIECNALKSWIPGGTIQRYIWNLRDGPPLRDDSHTFVLPDAAVGLRHLCLTVKGKRVSATDPFTEEAVSRTLCAWSVPTSAASGLLGKAGGTGRPKVVLTQSTSSGALEVVGHTSLWAPDGASSGVGINLIVHFPDSRTVAGLDFLTRALKESGRTDTATGIVAVLTPDQLAGAKPVDGIMFADDDHGWSHLLGVERRPATFVLGTSGEVVWHYQGELTSADLAAALRTHLVAGGVFRPRLLQSDVGIGQSTPNFLFESAPGRQLTLRKLAGRRVVLVFWESRSQASLETLRDLQKAFAGAGSQGPVVLAINDGEVPELAKRIAAENGLSAIVVPDPRRDISSAYGVNIWPTAIFLDERGLVSNIRYGRFSAELAGNPSPEKRPPASGQET